MVELAEALVEMVPGAEWALFGKKVADATQLAVMVARAATGRRRVISHHFRTKDDLTAPACNEVTRTIATRVSSAETIGSPERQLRAVALQLLPDDSHSNQAWKVWLHFLAAALSQPEHMQGHARATGEVRRHVSDLFRVFESDGLVGAGLDPDFEAAYLVALIDGLGTDSYISPETYGQDSFDDFVRARRSCSASE